MNIYKINDLSNAHIVNILKNSMTEDIFKNQSLAENYLYSFKEKDSNLFYILDAGRYKIGNYFVLTDDDDNFIASAGWNEYDKDTALLLTRMVVAPKHRTSYVLGLNVLPKMIEQTAHYKNVWILVNEYNKGLYDWFVRNDQGKSNGLFSKWPDIYKLFEPIGKKKVYYTEQYVLQLKNNYDV
jgi:hypothetical protein